MAGSADRGVYLDAGIRAVQSTPLLSCTQVPLCRRRSGRQKESVRLIGDVRRVGRRSVNDLRITPSSKAGYNNTEPEFHASAVAPVLITLIKQNRYRYAP
jgi:hypothetical protein